MTEINFTDMQNMQMELHKAHPDWGLPNPSIVKDCTLYTVEEIGEMAAILKKKGVEAIMEDEIVRANFTAEIADVLMYLAKIMLSLDISPQEMSKAFVDKHNYNMKRDFNKQNEKLYSAKPD